MVFCPSWSIIHEISIRECQKIFFLDYCAKISWKVTHIPNFMKIRPVVGEIRTWPYLAQLINLIFVNFFVFHYFQKGATWEGTTRGIKVSHQYLQIKPKRKKFWRPPSCHNPMIFLVLTCIGSPHFWQRLSCQVGSTFKNIQGPHISSLYIEILFQRHHRT